MSVRLIFAYFLIMQGTLHSAHAEKFIVERISKSELAYDGAESSANPKPSQRHRVVSRTRINEQKLQLEVGTRWQFDSHSIERVAVANEDVLVAQLLDSGKLVLVARRNGATHLRLWTSDGELREYAVEVTGSEYRSAILALSDEFGQSKNVEIFSANRLSRPMQALLEQVMR